MTILILEPYFTGSHKAWAKGYQEYSKHNIQILSLSGNFWKWRMHGGAVTLAKKFLESDYKPDLLLATDMLDLTTFLALTKNKTVDIPTAVYFHENQLTYPWSSEDRDVIQSRDRHYGFINYVTALSADAVFFNSNYHMQSFSDELHRFLKHFPDNQNLENVEKIQAKSQVLPLGLNLYHFDRTKPENRKPEIGKRISNSGFRIPLILWNHRWEFDKNPGEFFQALFILAEKGLEFQVAVLGECFSHQPKDFIMAREVLKDRIIQFGYVERFEDYATWLWRADILPVTSNQDFFGVSVLEAIYCNCFPILPKRLAYPELIPSDFHALYFYNGFDDLVDRLERVLRVDNLPQNPSLRSLVSNYNWKYIAEAYDERFQNMINGTCQRSKY